MADCDCTAHGSFLTAKGLKEAAQRERQFYGNPGVDLSVVGTGRGSVSALDLDLDLYSEVSDAQIDEQYRRFHNAS